MIRLTDDSEKEPIIQLSPMIDLVFLLLVVFIVATMYLTQTHALPVNLPKGEAPLVEQKAVTVTIDKKGTLHLDGKALSPKELEEAAQQLPKATPVIVEADETVPYGRVMGTLEILRRARVTDFSLAVEGGKIDGRPAYDPKTTSSYRRKAYGAGPWDRRSRFFCRRQQRGFGTFAFLPYRFYAGRRPCEG